MARAFETRHRGPWWAGLGLLLALGLLTLPALGQAPGAAPHAQRVQRATDVVRQWRPQQHLYVKGNLGPSPEALDALQQWLASQAANWVVVLVESAEGEQYTDAEGQSYYGVQAVEYALGKGLLNQTAFGQQTDPRTKERNAAFFALCLKDRKLMYYSSEAQDRRGLGKDRWVGHLDQPAVSAMRNGARVIDAAKDTITQINRRLGQSIASEIENRKQQAAAAALEQTRTLEQARAAIESARADYTLLEAKSGDLARQFNNLTGDLARPDLPALRAELQSATNALAQGDAARARKAAEALRARAQTLLRAIDQYPRDRQTFDSLASRLNREKTRRFAGSAARQISAAQAAMEAARGPCERGESTYGPLLQNATSAVETAAGAITTAERLAAQLRLVWLLGALSAAALLGVLALLLNRRRLPAKKEASELFALWNTAMSEKVNALFGLLDRRGVVVGVEAAEAAQRYSGETLRLSRQIIQDVDELFIMSACAGRVLETARDLVEPAALGPRLGNLFLAGRYRRAIARLREEPIAFQPEEGLELVVRGSRTERDRLIGGLASYQPFTMSFTALVEAFNQHAQRALAALDQVQSSLATAPDLLQQVQKAIETIQSTEPELSTAAAKDGLFGVPTLFGQLLPAAKAALAGALKAGINDPVGALQTDGARARQQTDDALALLALIRAARQETTPEQAAPAGLLHTAHASAQTLNQAGLKTGWLGEALHQLSDQAGRVVDRASTGSAASEIAALREGMTTLQARAQRAVALDRERREQAQTLLAQTTAAIQQGRRQIGSALNLPPEKTLREPGQDPTDFLTQAQAQFDAAAAVLERGDLDAARHALDAVQSLTSQAAAIVTASLEAWRDYAATTAARQAEAEELAGLMPEQARVLAEIQQAYAPTVLALGAGDAAHPNANGTIADNIAEVEAHLAAARELVASAAQAHAQARLLQGAALLLQAQGRVETGRHRLSEIAEKRARLAATETANQQTLHALEERARHCARLAQEPATMAPTLRAFEAAAADFERARSAALAAVRDPFDAAEQLARASQALEAVADRARCDRDVHEQAGRSLAAATSQLAETGRIAARASADGVPDSPAILQARAELGTLQQALPAARQEHQLPHGDWHAVDQEANRISNRAAAAAATLRGELERAEAAVAALGVAATTVRNAGAWTGGYGVTILGTPGADVLLQARRHLEHGDYDLARRVAENARGVAARAIAQAEAEVTRLRLAEQARREAERRRREAEEAARQQRYSSSSSSWGGSSSSWGGSSSGTSSSSFSSGSGVSTSSW